MHPTRKGSTMRRLIVLGVVRAALGFAGQASAASSFKVFLGEQARPPAGTPKGATLDAFLPSALTINAGDSVTFSSATFHTVTYVPQAAAALRPRPGEGQVRRSERCGGTPFYFVGLPKLIYNRAGLRAVRPEDDLRQDAGVERRLSPAGQKAGDRDVHVPVPQAGLPPVLQVHPGMKATSSSSPPAAPVPKTPAQVSAEALAGRRRGLGEGEGGGRGREAAGQHRLSWGSGRRRRSWPTSRRSLTVKAGTTVTFVNQSPSEVHNVVFGPKKYIPALIKKTDLLPQGPNSPNQVAPFLPFGSEPKGSYTYDGTNHGNGFFVDAADGGQPGRAAAAFVEGDVHEAGQVQLLLLDPRARHVRDDRRHFVTRRARAGRARERLRSRPSSRRRCWSALGTRRQRACASTGSRPCRSSGTSCRTSATRSRATRSTPARRPCRRSSTASTRRTGRS